MVFKLLPRTCNEELKALHQPWAAAVRLGKRRDLGWVVQHKRGLLQPRLHHLQHGTMNSMS